MKIARFESLSRERCRDTRPQGPQNKDYSNAIAHFIPSISRKSQSLDESGHFKIAPAYHHRYHFIKCHTINVGRERLPSIDVVTAKIFLRLLDP